MPKAKYSKTKLDDAAKRVLTEGEKEGSVLKDFIIDVMKAADENAVQYTIDGKRVSIADVLKDMPKSKRIIGYHHGFRDLVRADDGSITEAPTKPSLQSVVGTWQKMARYQEKGFTYEFLSKASIGALGLGAKSLAHSKGWDDKTLKLFTDKVLEGRQAILIEQNRVVRTEGEEAFGPFGDSIKKGSGNSQSPLERLQSAVHTKAEGLKKADAEQFISWLCDHDDYTVQDLKGLLNHILGTDTAKRAGLVITFDEKAAKATGTEG